MLSSLLSLVALTLSSQSGPAAQPPSPPALPRAGAWRAWLDSPGGELPFGLELEHERRDEEEGVSGRWSAVITNAGERLRYSELRVAPGEIGWRLEPYESWIEAAITADGTRLDGSWTRARGAGEPTRMAFHATHGRSPRFASGELATLGAPQAVTSPESAGRWRVEFESSEDVAVGQFEDAGASRVTGTFLTTLGDYRFVEGVQHGRRLRLSCFDGAHAFLFDATLDDEGRLAGDFWSRDSWHERWSATRDANAALPDDFGLTSWRGEVPLASLTFPDLDGTPRSLADAAFAGRARILYLFGSWCPNCGDATEALRALHERYAARGLSIVGLAFEFEDEPARTREVVRHYVDRKEVPFPVLVAGPVDKAEASRHFPALDRLRAYPTTVFLDATGRARAVHTGFSGPATGERHRRLLQRFDALVEELLAGARD